MFKFVKFYFNILQKDEKYKSTSKIFIRKSKNLSMPKFYNYKHERK